MIISAFLNIDITYDYLKLQNKKKNIEIINISSNYFLNFSISEIQIIRLLLNKFTKLV